MSSWKEEVEKLKDQVVFEGEEKEEKEQIEENTEEDTNQ